MLGVIIIKGIIIGNPISELYVNWRITSLHQFKIHQKPSSSAVTIYEWVDALKLNVESRELCDNMIIAR